MSFVFYISYLLGHIYLLPFDIPLLFVGTWLALFESSIRILYYPYFVSSRRNAGLSVLDRTVAWPRRELNLLKFQVMIVFSAERLIEIAYLRSPRRSLCTFPIWGTMLIAHQQFDRLGWTRFASICLCWPQLEYKVLIHSPLSLLGIIITPESSNPPRKTPRNTKTIKCIKFTPPTFQICDFPKNLESRIEAPRIYQIFWTIWKLL